MRIIHVIQTLDPAYGGPPITAVRLACAQARLGHEVHVLSYLHESETRIQSSFQGIPGIDKVKVHFLAKPNTIERILGRSAKKSSAGLFPGAQIVHLHGVWDTIIRVSAYAARNLGIPYVLTPHGMLDPWSMKQKGWKKKISLALLYRQVINNACFLHVLNPAEAELIEPLGTKVPTRVLPNGVFLEEIDKQSSSGSAILDRYDLHGVPFVLFLSRLHYKKGLDLLADSFARLCKSNSAAHLVVAGPDCGVQGSFESIIARHGLTSRVHVVGPVYGTSKYALLRSASCFCLPSRQEGFSIAVLEALACSVPVVISEHCHFSDVRLLGAGFVTALAPEQIAKALKTVMEDDGLRERMGQAGRRLVTEDYSWDRIADRCLSYYMEFVQH